jgi:hypothetical protein
MKIPQGSWFLLLAQAAFSQDDPLREDGDYNFDGYQDYRLQSATPGNQCGWWDYFLFDPITSEHQAVATAFCKEQFDAERKLVKTSISGGMAGLIYARRHFRWDGQSLVATYVESQRYDPERELFIFTRVTNLDSISGPTVISEIITRAEAQENAQAPQ